MTRAWVAACAWVSFETTEPSTSAQFGRLSGPLPLPPPLKKYRVYRVWFMDVGGKCSIAVRFTRMNRHYRYVNVHLV